MNRRKFATIASGIGITTLAGCSNSESENGEGSSDPPDVEVKFGIENPDLILTHDSGEVLQSGESVYVTVEGDQVEKKSLTDDVHAGGEIIRVTDIAEDFSGEQRIGLYLEGNDSPQEIAVTTISIPASPPGPEPNAQIDFDYDASGGHIEILHDGGPTLNSDNTGFLSVTGVDEATTNWGADVDDTAGADGNVAAMDGSSFSSGDLIVDSDVTGDEVTLVWENPDRTNSQEIGSYTVP